MLTFHVITLFPESLGSYLESSVIGRAVKNKKIRIKFYNPLDYARGKPRSKKNKWFYRQIDDRPYGGGPGMVLMAEPILKAVSKIKAVNKKIILFSPRGTQFSNELADKWLKSKKAGDIILICGRYEGVDARVKKILRAEELSIGPYVLTGGELPALVVMDTLARRLPGVLGKDASVEERRLAGRDVYTRPEVLTYRGKKFRVPKVLISGHHQLIDNWKRLRQNQSKR